MTEKKKPQQEPDAVGSELSGGLGASLDRISSAVEYTLATISPGNHRERRGDWVEIHGGRVSSAYRQLRMVREEIEKIRAIVSA